jgi:hypothetical protein
LTLPWSKILTVALSDRYVTVHRKSGGEAYPFDLKDLGKARHAHLVALTLLKRQAADARPTTSRKTRAKSVSIIPNDETERPSEQATSPHQPAYTATLQLPDHAGMFSLQVVGESYCQSALRALGGAQRLRGENVLFTAALVPDPGNAYDPNALEVHIHGGSRIGYLGRDDAKEFHEVARALRDRRVAGLCRAKLIGGTPGKPSLGAVLDLPDPAATLAAISAGDGPF